MSGLPDGPWWISENCTGRWDVLTYRDHETFDDHQKIAGAFIGMSFGDQTERRTSDNKAIAVAVAAIPDMLCALKCAAKQFNLYAEGHEMNSGNARASAMLCEDAIVAALGSLGK